jgi:hypothetical protein
VSEQPETVPTPGQTAQNEAARQAVILAFGIASVLLMIAAQKASGDPDFWRSCRMWAAKQRERFLARLAARSWRAAERARLAYERESA